MMRSPLDMDEIPSPRGHRRDYNPNPRKANPKAERILQPFVAWDGEGMTINGEHRYVYLANSLGGELFDPNGIATGHCLGFLSTVAMANPGVIHVMFGASYDVNMMLRDISYAKLKMLWEGYPEWTWFKDFLMTYRQRKVFGVRMLSPVEKYIEIRNKRGDVKRELNFVSSLRLWDVFGFFQSSFVTALEKWLGESYEDLKEIRRMKARRSDFSLDEIDAIRHYTQAELRALVALMDKLREHSLTAGLSLTRWDGAGAVAAALLKREGVKRHMAIPPLEVQRAAQHAYAGGRVELLQFGQHKGTVHHYDINSAYPFAMTFLPALKAGRWEIDNDARSQRRDFSVSLIRWRSPYRESGIYPFFFRDFNGSIYYPANGEGWHWEPEIRAAAIAREIGAWDGQFDVLKTYNFIPRGDDLPFAFVPDVYDLRLRWKNEGNPAERFLKLGPNSLYGKMAQQQSRLYQDDAGRLRHERPPYHQLEWAGWVTAFTRAKLFLAALTNPGAVIFLATDGIFATEPLGLSPIGTELGAWAYDTADRIVIVQNGLYWLWKDGKCYEKFRGFDPGTLHVEDVLRGWKLGEHTLRRFDTRFVGMGSVCSNPTLKRYWRQWRRYPHNLELEPYGSRNPVLSFIEWSRSLSPANRLIRTSATELILYDESGPYPITFLDEEWNSHRSGIVDGVPAHIIGMEQQESDL